MVKQTAMYSYHSLLHSNKKERIIDTCNMDKMPGHYTEWKELIPKVIWYFISLHCIFEMEKRWVITWSQGWVYKREVGVAIVCEDVEGRIWRWRGHPRPAHGGPCRGCWRAWIVSWRQSRTTWRCVCHLHRQRSTTIDSRLCAEISQNLATLRLWMYVTHMPLASVSSFVQWVFNSTYLIGLE